jgi:AAA family ATPase
MIFEITLKGKRKFIVESFIVEGVAQPVKIAKFTPDSSRVKIASEAEPTLGPVFDGLRPPLKVSGIAGVDQALKKLNNFLADFDNAEKMKPDWGRRACGLLIHGAHGSGKTLMLEKIAATGWGKVFHVDADTKLQAVREIFKEARLSAPAIIVIDDIETVVSSPKNEDKIHRMDKVLGEEMEKISSRDGPGAARVIVVAASTTPSSMPQSLRKRGRFTTEVILSIPNAAARKEILRSLAPQNTPEAQLELLDKLGERTHAYTPEDLGLLLDEACHIARRRYRDIEQADEETDAPLLQEDIDQALLVVRPTAMHDVTLQPPKVKWEEIGGQDFVKTALRRAVETPLLHPELLIRLGAPPKKGLLLYGPPGCSKTLLAASLATSTSFNFFAVRGAELLNMYVGESERAVRDIFSRARAAAPAIIFFDEIESIGAARGGLAGGKGKGGGGGGAVGVNVLTTLLNEMDGIESLRGVTVIAATNAPQALDLALLRPGRFDELLYVAPPDLKARMEILAKRRESMDWEETIDVQELASKMEGYSGAEVVAICQVAVDRVIDRVLGTGDMGAKVTREDFGYALGRVRRQITEELVRGYKEWAKGVGGGVEMVDAEEWVDEEDEGKEERELAIREK